MAATQDLVARVETLRAEVTHHKAAMRRHRDQLGAAKAALDTLEAECRRRGISLIIVHPHGAGGIHGPEQQTPS